MSNLASSREERPSDAPKSKRVRHRGKGASTPSAPNAPSTPSSADREPAADPAVATDGGYYVASEVIADVRKALDKMAALFAYVDGDPEACGANDRHRADFNASAASAASVLDFLRELLESNRIENLRSPQ